MFKSHFKRPFHFFSQILHKKTSTFQQIQQQYHYRNERHKMSWYSWYNIIKNLNIRLDGIEIELVLVL